VQRMEHKKCYQGAGAELED